MSTLQAEADVVYAVTKEAICRGWLTEGQRRSVLNMVEHGLSAEQSLIGTWLLTPEEYGTCLERIFQAPFIRLSNSVNIVDQATGIVSLTGDSPDKLYGCPAVSWSLRHQLVKHSWSVKEAPTWVIILESDLPPGVPSICHEYESHEDTLPVINVYDWLDPQRDEHEAQILFVTSHHSTDQDINSEDAEAVLHRALLGESLTWSAGHDQSLVDALRQAEVSTQYLRGQILPHGWLWIMRPGSSML